jgi:hypothetical protein
MPKQSRKPDRDVNQAAFAAKQRVIELTEGTPEPQPKPKRRRKNPAAVALGRLGGLKGGPARAAALGKDRLRESASKAARARWSKTAS